MKDWRKTLVHEGSKIIDTMRVIDDSSLQIALVVDGFQKLLGTVTDGDIRRAILRGVSLDENVGTIMKANPRFFHQDTPSHIIYSAMRTEDIFLIPIVDDNQCVVGVERLEDICSINAFPHWVVLMAGGLGNRLLPLTEDCPKPLLKVGDKPLLHTIVDNFIEQGFRKFYLSVNYKAEMIKQYFGDGTHLDIEVRYIEESKRMGTAGALSLILEKPKDPLIVMNGDLLTKVNFRHLLDFHGGHQALATMCVREYNFTVPYGVVKMDGSKLLGIEEKPVQRFFINAGIYVLNPEVLEIIPYDTELDMPRLFEKIISKHSNTAVFPIREYWMDIGQHKDYQLANNEYAEIFGR